VFVPDEAVVAARRRKGVSYRLRRSCRRLCIDECVVAVAARNAVVAVAAIDAVVVIPPSRCPRHRHPRWCRRRRVLDAGADAVVTGIDYESLLIRRRSSMLNPEISRSVDLVSMPVTTASAPSIEGRAGDDTIEGGDGADTIDGRG
jgi:Ca2+-binding RTX toxin-like protein